MKALAIIACITTCLSYALCGAYDALHAGIQQYDAENACIAKQISYGIDRHAIKRDKGSCYVEYK